MSRLVDFCLPGVLVCPWLRLEPLSLDHVPDLSQAASPDLLRYHLVTFGDGSPDEVRTYVEAILRLPVVPFAIVAEGRAVGVSCYMDILPEHRQLEIGMTWIGADWQRTHVNPAAKYLMLRHAFERVDCVRVQLKTDGRNTQSQRAIEKLGATREGTLRRHRIMPDGFVRDTVMYSILPEEWPAVRDRLLGRLAGFTPDPSQGAG